jgi:hypothetical protein
LRATVTYCEPQESTLFVQDATGGILVDIRGRETALQAGQVVELQGVTDAGPGPPIVVEPQVRVVGSAPMPPARRVTGSHLKGESARYQWVEIEGSIALFQEGGEPRLVVNEYRDFVRMRVADRQGRALETLVGPEMLVRGAYRLRRAPGSHRLPALGPERELRREGPRGEGALEPGRGPSPSDSRGAGPGAHAG